MPGGRLDGIVRQSDHHGHRGRTGEGRAAGQDVIGDGAQTVEVGAGIGPREPVACSGAMYCGEPAMWLSWLGSALERVRARQDEAEVEELDEVVQVTAAGGEDVRRLQVAVDQSGGVRLGQRPARLAEQEDGPTRSQRVRAARPGRQGSTRSAAP